jgi:hypothetical protein
MLILLVLVGRWLTFWYDEWDFIFIEPEITAASLLAPHVNHLSIVPILIYQAILWIGGLGSYWPFLAVTWLLHLASVWLLFRISTRLAGALVGFVAAVSLLFLGSAFEDLLNAFQLSFLASTAGGLLALDRLIPRPDGSRRARDLVLAGVGMALAVGSSSVGVLLLGVAFLYGLLRRDRSTLAVVLPIIIVYGAWYVTWGRQGVAGGAITPSGLVTMGATFLFGLGAAVSGVSGLPPERFAPAGLVVLGVAGLAAIVFRLRLSALGVAALLGLVAEYLLQAYFRSDFGIVHAARSGYLYPAAIFLWLTVADLVGRSFGPISLIPPAGRVAAPWFVRRAALLALLAVMVLGNMVQFVGAARATRDLRATQIAELHLIEQLRGVDQLVLDESPDPRLMPQVTGERYFEAVDRYGSPTTGYWLDPKATIDEETVAGIVFRLLPPALVGVDGMAPGPRPRVLEAGGVPVRDARPGCLEIGPDAAAHRVALEADAGAVTLSGPGASMVRVALGVSGYLPEALPDGIAESLRRGSALRLPGLPSSLAWVVQVDGTYDPPVEVCTHVGP